jgi:hypothetical protein
MTEQNTDTVAQSLKSTEEECENANGSAQKQYSVSAPNALCNPQRNSATKSLRISQNKWIRSWKITMLEPRLDPNPRREESGTLVHRIVK